MKSHLEQTSHLRMKQEHSWTNCMAVQELLITPNQVSVIGEANNQDIMEVENA